MTGLDLAYSKKLICALRKTFLSDVNVLAVTWTSAVAHYYWGKSIQYQIACIPLPVAEQGVSRKLAQAQRYLYSARYSVPLRQSVRTCGLRGLQIASFSSGSQVTGRTGRVRTRDQPPISVLKPSDP